MSNKGSKITHNFLPQQYQKTGQYTINHNYLREQFADCDVILSEIKELVLRGDYTLGESVDKFEQNISQLTGSRFVIGVGSGTDALFLSLKAAGIDAGDEVITTPYTFFATVGAIVTAGAKPVFVDIRDDYNIDASRIERAITPKTKAIIPVHWSGLSCEMDMITQVAQAHKLVVIEDACHGIRASYKNKPVGTFGLTGCFSMHPLKNLNVWGDGGYVVTDSQDIHDKLVLLRNHGLVGRDECAVFGYNSRLDSIQAIVANHLLKKIDSITEARISHAAHYDRLLSKIPQVTVPKRPKHVTQVYHLYIVRAERRNELKEFLVGNGIDAKVHYPVPLHLQPAANSYGYRRGDFPTCEAICDSVISFPVHEFVTNAQIEYVVDRIKEFYAESKGR